MLAPYPGESPLRHQVGKLIGSLGEDQFEADLLTTLNAMFRVDLYAVFPFDRDDRLTGIIAASKPNCELARDLSWRFSNKYWRGDAAILGAKKTSCSNPRFWRTRWNDVISEELRREFYCRVGIVEKLSTRLGLASGSLIWSVYRRDQFFSDNEFEMFRDMGDVMSAAIAKHLRICEASFPLDSSGRASRSSLLSSIERRAPHLSGREREVCEGIARGKTTNVMAQELGIKFSSVLTYKKRVYEKVGVSTQRELMAVMLHDSTSKPESDNRAN